MKKALLMLAYFLITGYAMASDVLTVENVTLPQNSEATISINCSFDTQFKGFQLDVVLDGGLTLTLDEDSKPLGQIGFEGTDHSVSSTQVSEGHYRFVVVSMNNKLLPKSGTLLKVRVTGASEKTVGDSFNAHVKNVEFTTMAKEVNTLDDVDFTITIGEAVELRTLLDETSTVAPVAETGANVRVNRTIKAGQWSTICLPFAMTAEQVKAAFGDDVLLGDFTSWSSEEDGEGDIVGIKVGFTEATAIEANHPYIIKVGSDVSTFTVDGVDITPEAEPTLQVGTKKAERGFFYGTYVAETAVPEENLFLSGGKFWYSTGATKMKAYRGYFEFYDILASYYDETASAPRITIDIDGQTTGVGVIENGQWIVDDGKWYTLDGRQCDGVPTQKGVYIVNGRKTVIK